MSFLSDYKNRLQGTLTQLEFFRQLAFASSCCQRTISLYDLHAQSLGVDETNPLSVVLDATFASAMGAVRLDRSFVDECIGMIERLDVDDTGASEFYGFAQDAGTAVWVMLDFCNSRSVKDVEKVASVCIDIALEWTSHVMSFNYAGDDTEAILEQMAGVTVPATDHVARGESQARFADRLGAEPFAAAEMQKQLFDLSVLATSVELARLVPLLRKSSTARGPQPALRGLYARAVAAPE